MSTINDGNLGKEEKYGEENVYHSLDNLRKKENLNFLHVYREYISDIRDLSLIILFWGKNVIQANFESSK